MTNENIIVLSGSVADSQYEIEAFFDFIDDESKTGEAQITDNWVESNYSIQDHIAIAPKIYRLKGYVGEVVYENPTSWLKWAENKIANNSTLNKLYSIFKVGGALMPITSSYTRGIISIIEALNSSYDRYKKVIKTMAGKYPLQGKRQNTCNSALFHLLDTRSPVVISRLAFERKQGKEYVGEYYIQSIKAHQGNTLYKSDFEVVLKEVRIANTEFAKIDKAITEKANAIQAASETVSGSSAKQAVPASDVANGFKKITEIKNPEQKTLVEKIKTFTTTSLANFKYRNYYKDSKYTGYITRY